jgi:CHAD domain-containing protein
MDLPLPNPAFLLLQTATGDALARMMRPQLGDDAVHEARKAIKKARTALRLLRPVLGDDNYRTQNAALRDAGQCLSPLRDARILLSTIDALGGADPELERHAVEIARLRRSIESRLSAARARLAPLDARQRCIEFIEAVRVHLGRQELAQAGFEAMQLGLAKIYRKSREAFACACQVNTAGNLHEWRKQTKHLRAAALALRPLAAQDLHVCGKIADDISGWLGDDHDLAVLRDTVRDGERMTADAARDLIDCIEARRAKLQRKAFAAGEDLFAKKPKRFLAQVL